MSRMGKGLGIRRSPADRSVADRSPVDRSSGVRSVVGGRARLDRPRRGGAPSYPADVAGVSRAGAGRRARPVSSIRSAASSRPDAVRGCGWDDVYFPMLAEAGPVVLTRRGRLVVSLLVLVLALAGFAMMGRGADAVVNSGYERGAATQRSVDTGAELDSVVVRPGDTVWTIAEQVAPDADPRATIDRIKDLNGLDDLGAVRIGDRLVVPGGAGH